LLASELCYFAYFSAIDPVGQSGLRYFGIPEFIILAGKRNAYL